MQPRLWSVMILRENASMQLAQRLYRRYGPTVKGAQAIAQRVPSDALEELLDLVQSDPELAALLREEEVTRDELRSIFFGVVRAYNGNALVGEKFVAASALTDAQTFSHCVRAFRAEDQAPRLSALAAQLFTYFSQSRPSFL